jgi:intracellular multiplication protein IcmJ
MLHDLLPLVLSAKRGNWQRFMGRKTNKAFLPVRDRVLERDDHTCRYCGFQSQKYQEIVNADQNYSHNTLSNLVTACQFCAQCFFLDSVGLDGKSGGVLIQLPEISQADLNHFCRALFCSMLRDAPYKGKLQAAYLSLQDRAKPIEDVFGAASQNPVTFGQSMIDCGLNDTQQKHHILSELKLLPLRKFYKEQSEYWKTTVFANIPL